MIKKRFVILLFVYVLNCTNSFAKTINSNLFSFNYIENIKSVPGKFVFSPTRSLFPPTSDGIESELVLLNTNGKIEFNKIIKKGFVNNFAPMGSHDYCYYICTNPKKICKSKPICFDHNNKVLALNVEEKDSHEIFRKKNGNFIYTNYFSGKNNDYITDGIEERNSKQEKVFSWYSIDKIIPPALTDAQKKIKEEVLFPNETVSKRDYFHLNSFFVDNENNIWLTLSHLNKILKIKYPTGDILYDISSPEWKFINDKYNGFIRPHSIKFLDKNRVLIFDNGNGERPSRAVEYLLDFKNKTATITWEYEASFKNNISEAGGSVQRLSNGNILIGWGYFKRDNFIQDNKYSLFTEVTQDKKVARELTSSELLMSYRVYFEEENK